MSRTNGRRLVVNGLTMETEPSTSEVMNTPPPRSEPTPIPAVLGDWYAAYEVKKSGAPLPSARSVTPATLGESFRLSESRSRLGTMYSSAVDATTEKRKRIQHAAKKIESPGTQLMPQ
eukprot:4619862-Prymnesium_polylepis.1